MRNYIFSLFCLLALTACVTVDGYKSMLSSWHGQTEESLVSTWGPPDSTYVLNDTKYLTYNHSESMYVAGTPTSYRTQYINNVPYSAAVPGQPAYSYNQTCKTIFIIKNKAIQSWQFEGNNCVAEDPELTDTKSPLHNPSSLSQPMLKAPHDK